MKILNWVHRKLHLNTNYSQVSSQKKDVYVGDEGKMTSPKKALEQDTEALLLQDVLNGILTIGTLGHSHAFLADQTNCTAGEEEPASEEVEEEVVMHVEEKEATDQHVAVGAVSGAGAGQHPLRVVELSTIKLPISLEEKCVTVAVPETEEILELPLLMEDKEKLERRTTLADLFAAEAINESAAAADKISSANYVRINSSSEQQQGAADQKKLMKQRKKYKGEQKPSTSTSKKFQKLITRMLKKKIHPAEMAAPPVAAGKDHATKEISYADQKPRHGPVRATW